MMVYVMPWRACLYSVGCCDVGCRLGGQLPVCGAHGLDGRCRGGGSAGQTLLPWLQCKAGLLQLVRCVCVGVCTSPLRWLAGICQLLKFQCELQLPKHKTRGGEHPRVLHPAIPAGITNERGAWITPAFQVHASKLDMVRQAGALPVDSRVGRPVLLPPGAFPAVAQQQQTSAGAAAATAIGQQRPPAVDAASQAAALQQQQGHTSQALEQQSKQQGPHQFECLLLDCDGVLVDTEVASCESLHLAILEVGEDVTMLRYTEDMPCEVGALAPTAH
jgi:hypothetical protein